MSDITYQKLLIDIICRIVHEILLDDQKIKLLVIQNCEINMLNSLTMDTCIKRTSFKLQYNKGTCITI